MKDWLDFRKYLFDENLAVRTVGVISGKWAHDNLALPATPADVAKISAGEWLRVPNCGRKTIAEISKWLAEKGLSMPDPEGHSREEAETYELALLAHLKKKYETGPQAQDWIGG